MTMKRIAAAGFLILCVGGCASDYYKVTDPTTGKDYYTTKVDRNKSGGATLKDGRTGKEVTLQNSEIAKVSKEQYDAGRFAPPPAPAEKADPNPFSK